MKIVVIGGVASTEVLIKKLRQYHFDDVLVCSYQPQNVENVSGWVDLKQTAREGGYEAFGFIKVNECKQPIVAFKPDIIFAVGLSQIVSPDILCLAEMAVGFHPTQLPKGRGRAPIAWLLLEKTDGAATFFVMREGVDDGPILVQEPFRVSVNDNAASVMSKLLQAENVALDRWLPSLMNGDVRSVEQNHDEATWYGKRAPEDGVIDWYQPCDDVLSLIRASTYPHPGAFTFSNTVKVKILVADKCRMPIKGVIGRILDVSENHQFVVQCRDGVVKVRDWSADAAWEPKVGIQLGLSSQVELFELRLKYNALEKRLSALEQEVLKR